ncbi:hypothetical protein D560_0005 [Bordetella holmesii ATCC 51541]|nr:hypothetical protein D560_0005 [Bordetella holmesii ATCC 51541]
MCMEGKTSRQRFSEEFKVQAVKQVTEGDTRSAMLRHD